MKKRLLSKPESRHSPAVLLLAAAVLGSGCGPKSAADAPYDLQFIDTMTAHHEAAIALAQAVGTMTTRPELKDFARHLVDAQSREISQMTEWRAAWFKGRAKAVNMALTGMAESMTDMDPGRLEALAGPELDLAFIKKMIPHHHGAVAMSREAASRAQHQELKTLAKAIFDMQQLELEIMRRWQEEWKPPEPGV